MKFAPNTPESVMRKDTEEFYNKKVDKTQPPPTDGKKPVFRDVMPRMGGEPKISDEEKAAHEKKLAEKIKANTPQPTQPTTPQPTKPTTPQPTRSFLSRATTPTPPAKPTPRVVGPSPMPKPMPQPTQPTKPTKPISLVGMPKTSRPEMPPPSMAMKKGGSVSKASSRADGIAKKGKTKGRYI